MQGTVVNQSSVVLVCLMMLRAGMWTSFVLPPPWVPSLVGVKCGALGECGVCTTCPQLRSLVLMLSHV